MLLDALKNFSWLNEPSNVRFVEEGMLVETEPETDFWSAAHHNFSKDNGHFFYTEKQDNFELILKWRFIVAESSDQCGLMIRFDSRNWAKIGFLSPRNDVQQIGCVCTLHGVSDWSSHYFSEPQEELWYKVVRRGDDFIFSYSTDGKKFVQARMFRLVGINPPLKVGAYCCSPKPKGFECILESLDLF